MAGRHFLHASVEPQFDAGIPQYLFGIRVCPIGKRRQDGVPVIDQRDRRRPNVNVGVLGRHDLAEHLGQSAGDFDAGGTGPNDHHVQRPPDDAHRLTIHVLENLEDARPQPLGIVER